MSAQLYPGCKVECVNDAGTYGLGHPVKPIIEVGREYTISAVYRGYDRVDGYVLGLNQCVVDIVGSDIHFCATRFRPIRREYMALEELREIVRKEFASKKQGVDA